MIILVDNKPGIRVTEILNCLKITKQSLNRVIQDLIKKNLISLKKGEKDGREKKIYLTDKGIEFGHNLFNSQKSRILNAFKKSSPDEVLYFKNVLKRIIE